MSIVDFQKLQNHHQLILEKKNICYRGEDCMEKYCKKVREWVMQIVNYETKEMAPLTNDENDYHEKQN